ncbi:MAG: carbohydrate ABC transporter permease [Anaeroplasma sp.]
MKRLDRTEIVFKVLSYVLLTIFALCCLYPFVFILANSISSKNATQSGSISIIPDAFNLAAYQYVFEDQKFWLSYCNSFFVTMYGTLVSMLVGICGAYALSKPRLMFGRGFNFMLVFTMWFNAGLIPTYNNFQTFHVDNIYMFIIALGFNAFNIILLRNYFSSVSTEIEEAATIDGATEFQILTKVYIPMSKSSIVTVAMFYAVSRWNGYLWAQMLLSEDDYPLTVYIRRTVEDIVLRIEEDPSIASKYDFSTFSIRYAFIVCSIIPIIIIYPKLQKYFAAGVNVGGVKE